jgi:competence protein ComEC
MSGVFFYTLLLSFASGIFLRSFFIIPTVVVIWLGVMSFGLSVWSYRKRSTPSVRGVVLLACMIGGIATGSGRINLAEYLSPAALLLPDVGQTHSYIGRIIREPEKTASGKNIVVQIGRELVLVKTDSETKVQYGDTVSIVGKLALPEPFITDLGREFDYLGYLRAKGISYTMSFGKVTVTDSTTGNPLLRFLFTAKERFITALAEVLPEPEVGLGKGLLLGVNHALTTDLEDIFRRAGIIHIVVLSGYNIMLVVQCVLLVLAGFLPLRTRTIVGMVAIAGFALVVGLGASVVRASIMAALTLVALLFGRRYAVTRALFLAGAVMLVVNPYLLVHDLGFQLSFMATLGLLLLSPELERLALWVPEKFGLRGFLLATIATQIAVLPILLYSMGQFSLISLAVNLLVLPVVSIAMLVTFCTGLVALVSPSIALIPGSAAYVVLAYIIGIATKCASLPFAVVTVSFFPWYGVPLLYLLLGAWLYYRTVRRTIPRAAQIDLSPVAHFTIVEETETVRNEKGPVEVTGPSSRVSKSDTPMFFR